MPDSYTASKPAYVWLAGGALVALAFIAASLTSTSGWLSFVPPGHDASDLISKDIVTDETAVTLYQTVYTAWAAVLMTAPAMATVWERNRSTEAANWWRLYWTVGLIVFLVHLIWAIAVFYDGDFDAMKTTTRVSAFWPGLVFTAWWIIDVALAWTRPEDHWLISIQRVCVHVAAFVMFVVGSVDQGELLFAKLIGGVFLVATLYGGARWIATRAKS